MSDTTLISIFVSGASINLRTFSKLGELTAKSENFLQYYRKHNSLPNIQKVPHISSFNGAERPNTPILSFYFVFAQNSRKISLHSDRKYPIWCIMNMLELYPRDNTFVVCYSHFASILRRWRTIRVFFIKYYVFVCIDALNATQILRDDSKLQLNSRKS